MKQQTLAMAADQNNGFEHSRKPTRREEFLRTMETIVPWAALCQVIEPHYPRAGNGRPPIGLERMLRIHFLQHWFNLADLMNNRPRQTLGWDSPYQAFQRFMAAIAEKSSATIH